MISLPDNLILPTDIELSSAAPVPREVKGLQFPTDGFESVEKYINEEDSPFDAVFAGIMLTMQTPSELVSKGAAQPLHAGVQAEPMFEHDGQLEPQTLVSVAELRLSNTPTEVPDTGDESQTRPPRVADVVSGQHIPFDQNVIDQSLSIPLASSSTVSINADDQLQKQTEHNLAPVAESNFTVDKQPVPVGLVALNAATVVRPPNPSVEPTRNSVPMTVSSFQSKDASPPESRTTDDIRLSSFDHAVEVPEEVTFAKHSRQLTGNSTDLANLDASIPDQLIDQSEEPRSMLLSTRMSNQHYSPSTTVLDLSSSMDSGVLTESIAREIIEHARIENGINETRIELELDPPELGRVFVRLSETSEGITARIVVAKEHVWQALGESLADFQSTLADAGIDLRDFSLSQQEHGASKEFSSDSSFPNTQTKSNSDAQAATNRTQHFANYQTRSDRVIDIRA